MSVQHMSELTFVLKTLSKSADCLVQEGVNAAELKRIIEGLPLETSAVAAVEWRLGQLEPSQFAALLTELARDNHAFRYVCSVVV